MQRYRITFLSGLAVGFVLGARAGRERYEQLKQLTRRVADHPAAQQAAGAVQAQAAGLAKAARQKVTDRMPKVAETANKVSGRVSGLRQRNGGPRQDGGTDGPQASGDHPVTTKSTPPGTSG